MQGVSDIARRATRHWRDDRTNVFLAISFGWFLSIGVRMVFPVLLPFFRSGYGLSLTLAGFLLTVLWLAYAFGQIPGGMMADRFGEGRTMVVSMLVGAAMLTLIVVAGSPIVLFVGTALLGVAIALFGVVRLTALADVYPEQVGSAHGVLGAVGDLGNTLLPPLAGLIAVATVWQLGLGFFIPFFVLAALFQWRYVPNRTSPASDAAGTITRENVRMVLTELRRKPLVLATVIMIFGMMIIQTFTGFYPTYLNEVKGLSLPVASGLYALFFALGVLVRPLSGTAYDRVGVRKSLFAIVGVSAVGFALLPFVDGLVPLGFVTVLIAFMGGRGTVALAYMTMSLSSAVQNTGLGIMRTIFFVFGAMSPVLFGAVADRGYFDEVFLVLAVMSGVSLFVILLLPPVER